MVAVAHWIMTYVLGVDGGNSKTLAVLADQTGRVRGIGRGENSNHQGVGVAAAMAEVHRAGEAALQMAGLTTEQVETAYYSLSGADLPEDFALLRPALQALSLARTVDLTNDTIAALRAGTENPDAVVVIVGTGSNAAGRNRAGQEIRLPGLGWISGDWGGGDAMARDAMRLVARAWDGRGEPTTLTGLLLDAAGEPDVLSLISALYLGTAPRRFLHVVPPLIFEAAEAGDAVAAAIVRRQGLEAATMAEALLRRLDLLEVPTDVVLAGSVFRGCGTLLLDTIRDHLAPITPRARLVRPAVEPAIGALYGALELAGVTLNQEVRRRAAESYAGLLAGSGQGG